MLISGLLVQPSSKVMVRPAFDYINLSEKTRRIKILILRVSIIEFDNLLFNDIGRITFLTFLDSDYIYTCFIGA